MFNEDQARKLFASHWWKVDPNANDEENAAYLKKLAIFQLSQNVMCMPYFVYHLAVEESVGEGMRAEKLHALRFDLLQILTGKKYVQSDEECLQLLPIDAREVLK